MCSQVKVMLLVAMVLTWAGATVPAQADTIGYWRFEDGALTDDSSGNANNLTAAGGPDAPVAYTLPASGAGSAFPNPIPQNGLTNGQGSEQFNGGRWDAGNGDNQFVASTFTIEAFINVDPGDHDNQRTIASVYGSENVDQAWLLRVKEDNGEVTLRVEDGSGEGDNVRPTTKVTFDKDYYIAAVFTPDTIPDANADGSVTFYLQNLTDGGSLVVETIATDAAAPDSSIMQALQIGRGNGNEFVGVLDEVRYSNTALSQSELLAVVPEPGSMALLGLGGLCMFRRLRTAK